MRCFGSKIHQGHCKDPRLPWVLEQALGVLEGARTPPALLVLGIIAAPDRKQSSQGLPQSEESVNINQDLSGTLLPCSLQLLSAWWLGLI